MVANGNVLTFDFEQFPIDLILIDEEDWEMAPYFYNYDPLGSLVGKIAKKFDLTFSPHGLYFSFRSKGSGVCRDILVSNNPEQIFRFLGFNFERYQKGFETLHSIFKFIVSSSHFNGDFFALENLSSKKRNSMSKRKRYLKFLVYIEKKRSRIKECFYEKDPSMYLGIIDHEFPEANILMQISECERVEVQKSIISEKFNGQKVMLWVPELSAGLELGRVLLEYRHSKDDFNAFLLSATELDLEQDFKTWYLDFLKKRD